MRLSLKEVDHEIMTLTVAAFLEVKKMFLKHSQSCKQRYFSFGTTLDSMTGAEISQQRFSPCHEKGSPIKFQRYPTTYI